MRKFKTRKGPPPQRNMALIQAAREAAAIAAGRPVRIPSETLDITIDLPPLETPDAGDKPETGA